MKKIINLGTKQALLLKEILREQYQFCPKKVSKFTIKQENDENILFCDGKLDIEYFGQLMYMLGMKIK